MVISDTIIWWRLGIITRVRLWCYRDSFVGQAYTTVAIITLHRFSDRVLHALKRQMTHLTLDWNDIDTAVKKKIAANAWKHLLQSLTLIGPYPSKAYLYRLITTLAANNGRGQ